MTWDQRLRPAAYTGPSGTRIDFTYENVTQSVTKRTSAFDFPDVDGSYIQDLGHSGRRFPLRVIFHGRDCDLEADAFETVLLEKGRGTLDHPMYGTREVVPFGAITRRDDLKTAANQVIVELTFFETIDVIYPINQADAAVETAQAVNAFNGAGAGQFLNVMNLGTTANQVNFKNTYLSVLNQAKTGLATVAATTKEVESQFDTVNDSINNGIDTLIGDPLTLAFQTSILIQAPARAAADIGARLSAYRNLATSLISGDGAASRGNNDFHGADLYASGYVSGSVVSVINADFNTRPEAVEAAEELLNQFDELAAWRDENFEFLSQIDTGESYQSLLRAVSLAAGFLVSSSFGLKQERRVVLDSPVTMIQLCSRYYNSVDDETLDFFIVSNDLTGSEIYEEIPQGREVVYYV